MLSRIAGLFNKGDELIVTELVLPEDAAHSPDPYAVIQCNIDFVNHLLQNAHFMPAQIIPEPFWSYQVDYYLCQVKNGGHAQYVHNSRIADPQMKATIENTQRGLAAMGAADFAALYDDLLNIFSQYPLDEEALDKLDDRFWKLDVNGMTKKNREFLLSLASLRLVPTDTWIEEVEKLSRLNSHYEKRAKEPERETEKHDENDPFVKIASDLCREARRNFVRLVGRRRCKLDGETSMGIYMLTDKGPAVMLAFEKELVLCKIDELALPDLMKMSADEAAKWLSENTDNLKPRTEFSRDKDVIASIKT
jgi:hypothetical protein